MYSRLLSVPKKQSFFLFGPRGTGKTAWLRRMLPGAAYFDLLDHATYLRLASGPERLADEIPKSFRGWIVIDETQRIPELLNEVHRLIEGRGLRFALTGSSARKLRRRGVNLLAGRAVTRAMHPLVCEELGPDFETKVALERGLLPFAYTTDDPEDYLSSYVATYLREEVQQEGFVRNIGAFGRFLEAASFSQGSVLNMAAVARESATNAKTVEDYFQILEDLLLAIRIPVFTRRAKRRLVAHPKFFFFDAGVFRTIRPLGPLDSTSEVSGPALETLVLGHLRAMNDYLRLGYTISYWRTSTGEEVDFVLYGKRGFHAIEVKSSSRIKSGDLDGLALFREEYPMAKTWLLYGGTRAWHEKETQILPVESWLREIRKTL